MISRLSENYDISKRNYFIIFCNLLYYLYIIFFFFSNELIYVCLGFLGDSEAPKENQDTHIPSPIFDAMLDTKVVRNAYYYSKQCVNI